MGAYYTKEDITGYIARNTLIPYLFNAAEQKCAIAFKPDSALWRLLRDDPDRYIYPAMRKGVDLPLPPEIAAGENDVSKRGDWNKAASPECGLPTETWREHTGRRQRCHDLGAKLAAGEIHDINDFITYNLDICQFAEDVIANSEGPELLRAFYHAIGHVSVLDPTCGSGAFLFAALNLLEPLYEACLNRMHGFLDDLKGNGAKHHPEKFSDFRKILDDVERHPNHRYFILKSVIVGNLYGVDIMEEAVEICKLRLFLKLVAQVEKVQQIEPLPDIDFNIRAGNTLIGFASLDEVKKRLAGTLGFQQDEVDRIGEEAEIVDRAFKKFRQMQTEYGMDAKEFFSQAKTDLRSRLAKLRAELDRYLAGEYGIDPDKPKLFQKWRESHLPFHWMAEFYGIMSDGGFDVIIGNPPWIEYAKVKKDYIVHNYQTEPCGNLHALCTERGLQIRSPSGYMSFIVQLPVVSSSRMSSVRRTLREASGQLHAIPFGDRPGKLFDGLEHSRATIWISSASKASDDSATRLATCRYQRWPTEDRPFLFNLLEYTPVAETVLHPDQFPKYANRLAVQVFQKLTQKGAHRIGEYASRSNTRHFVFYQEATEYWVKATVGLPYYSRDGTVAAPAHGRYLYFAGDDAARWVCATMHSSLFFVYFTTFSDCFHLSDNLVRAFPVPKALAEDKKLAELGGRLMEALQSTAERKTIRTRDGYRIAYDEYYGWKSKAVIDQIDYLLGKHFGFNDEELDFIINYDIKFRMGQDGADDEE
jgi:hypothetical protein